MRRILLAVTMAIVMAAMLALNAGFAFATPYPDNPNYFTTPAAGVVTSPGGACVDTYNAPPAEGGAAPGSTAAGGAPGSSGSSFQEVGNNC